MSMQIRSADRSVIKAIRQRSLLTEWSRHHVASGGGLPSLTGFCPAFFEEEKGDMLIYAVTDASAHPRLIIRYDGQRLSQAYAKVGMGSALQDVMGPKRAAAILPIYYACVQCRLPIYSICAATDVHGTHVDFERLLLPFGSGGRVTDLIASLKTISVEGSFEQKQLLRTDEAPLFSLIAVIDTDLTAQRVTRTTPDDVEVA
jgi:hypothetical protein